GGGSLQPRGGAGRRHVDRRTRKGRRRRGLALTSSPGVTATGPLEISPEGAVRPDYGVGDRGASSHYPYSREGDVGGLPPGSTGDNRGLSAPPPARLHLPPPPAGRRPWRRASAPPPAPLGCRRERAGSPSSRKRDALRPSAGRPGPLPARRRLRL